VKYSPERCTLGPPKGLEEKELLALAANKDLNFTYIPKPVQPEPKPEPEPCYQEAHPEAAVTSSSDLKLPYPSAPMKSPQDIEEKTLVPAGGRF